MVNPQIRLIIFFAAKDGEALYSQQKQDQELTVAQIMNSLPRVQGERTRSFFTNFRAISRPQLWQRSGLDVNSKENLAVGVISDIREGQDSFFSPGTRVASTVITT